MSAMLAVMATLVFIQVLFRYLLNRPLDWTEEAARYLMIWVGLLGAALCVQSRSHIGLSFIANALPARARAALVVAGDVAVFLFLMGFLVAGIRLLETAMIQQTPALRISFVWVYAAAPVSTGLMLLFLLKDLVAGGRAGREPDGTRPAESRDVETT